VQADSDKVCLDIVESTGRTTKITVKHTDTVYNLKALIERAIDIPIERQRLFYEDQELRNDASMLVHDIRDESSIVVQE